VLIGQLTPALVRARMRRRLCDAPSVREFAEFAYQTQKSWSRARRVMGKAAGMTAGDNPRFIVANLPAAGWSGDADRARFTPARLEEEFDCARGERENVLKPQVPELEPTS
jgi:hypothetical protein